MIRTNNRVALYARFSSDNQRSESIDAQIRAMKNYCDYNNIAIIETYIDEAKSATTAQRPAFQKMIADSKSHNFDVVVVHKLDRFAPRAKIMKRKRIYLRRSHQVRNE